MSMPPTPKHPSVRANRSKHATRAELVVREGPIEIPPPPTRYITEEKREDGQMVKTRVEAEWHPQALQSWEEIYSSPMLEEFLEADFGAIRQLLALEHDFWERLENKSSVAFISAEITRLRKLFGLLPMGRRSLQWTIAATGNQLNQARKAPKQLGDVTDTTAIELPDAKELADGLYE